MGTHPRWRQSLSTDEQMRLASEQRSRLRKERLLQVRRQDAILAAVRVREFRAQVASGQQRLAQQLETEWKLERQQKIEELEAGLAAALADVGRSQRQARDAVEEKARKAEAAAIRAVENLRNAQARFQGAMKEEQNRRDELQADHRAAEARRKALEEAMRVERALAQIAAQNAELRQRAEEAAAATREPRVLPVIDDLSAFRFTCLHRQLLERTPLTNIPGAENAPPEQVVKFASQDVHIKGLDDSRVAAEVERRRIEADKERRERARREAQSRTDEREAAAHFRVGVWRQRKEAAAALARARRFEAVERQRALFPIDELETSPIQPPEPEPASVMPEFEVPAVPTDGPEALRTAPTSEAQPSAPAAPNQPEPGPTEEATLRLSEAPPQVPGPFETAIVERPGSSVLVSGTEGAEGQGSPGQLAADPGESVQEGVSVKQGGKLEPEPERGTEPEPRGAANGAKVRSPALEGEADRMQTEGGAAVPGNEIKERIGGGTPGWLPRIGEDSPFVERGGRTRVTGDVRGPLEDLVNLARAEEASVLADAQEREDEEVTAALGLESEPEEPEEVPGMGLREVLEELVALETARNGEAPQDLREVLRIVDEREDRQRPENPEVGPQGDGGMGAAGRAEGASEVRQSLEEFIALERELYEMEQRGERLRERARTGDANLSSNEFGDVKRRGEESGEGVANQKRPSETTETEGRGSRRRVDARTLGGSSAPRSYVSRRGDAEGEALGSGACEAGLPATDRTGLANPSGLEVSTARQPLSHWGFDYASSDFTLMSSPTSGLSPFSLLTSPLSTFSEDDLDALLGVHVSSFELGQVSALGTLEQDGAAAEPGVGSTVREGFQIEEGQVTVESGLFETREGEVFQDTVSPKEGTSAAGITDERGGGGRGSGFTTEREELRHTSEPLSTTEPASNGGSSGPTSSLIRTSETDGTGRSVRISDPGPSTSIPSSELTLSLTPPSSDLPTTSTGRLETGDVDVSLSIEESVAVLQREPTYPPLSPRISQPVSKLLPTDSAFAPGNSQPSSEVAPGQQPGFWSAEMGGVLPGALEPGAQPQRPVDDIFARLKRELDEFDERLDAVRADVFAHGGVVRLPSSTSGLPSTSTTSNSEPPAPLTRKANPPSADVSTEGPLTSPDVALLRATQAPPEQMDPAEPPPSTDVPAVDDVTMTSIVAASLLAFPGASLTVSRFSLATSSSSPVSENPLSNPAPNPSAQLANSSSLEPPSGSDPVALTFDATAKAEERFVFTAGEAQIEETTAALFPESQRQSIAAALGLSETSSEGLEAPDPATNPDSDPETLVEGSAGDEPPASSWAVDPPERARSAVDGDEVREAPNVGAAQHTFIDESDRDGDSARFSSPLQEGNASLSTPEFSERFSPSDSSLTATWRYRSSSLLAAPSGYRIGTQPAPFLEELTQGFFKAEDEGSPEEGVRVPDEAGPVESDAGLATLTGEVLEVQPRIIDHHAAERQEEELGDPSGATMPVTRPLGARDEEELQNEALSFAPLPSSPRLPSLETPAPELLRGPSLRRPEAHFAEDLLRRSLSPPGRGLKPPNLAAALALLDRPTELLTFDEQLEALAAELRKLDRRLHVATSQSVSGVTGSGEPESGNGEGGQTAKEEVGGRVGHSGGENSTRIDEGGDVSGLGRGAGADVSGPAGGVRAEMSSSAGGENGIGRSAEAGAGQGDPQQGTDGDVSSRRAAGQEAVPASPLREDLDVRTGSAPHGTEASGDSSDGNGSQHEPEPESSESPDPGRKFQPFEGPITRVDVASLSSVGWAAALDINGPDSLLARSADFSPWTGSEFSNPSPGFEGLAGASAELDTGARFLGSPTAGGLTAPERSPQAEVGEVQATDSSDAETARSELNARRAEKGASGGKANEVGDRSSRAQVGGREKTGKQKRKTPSSSKRRVVNRTGVAGRGLVSAAVRATTSALNVGGAVAVAIPGKATSVLEAFSPQKRPPRGSAGLPNPKRRGSVQGGSETPSPSAKLPRQLVSNPPATGTGSAALQSPSKASGLPTPGSVTSSWSSFASGKSARREEPGKRFEVSLRSEAEGELGGRPGSKEEAERRRRAKELKEKARTFDKEQRDKRRAKPAPADS